MESIKGCLTVLLVAAALCTPCSNSSRCIAKYPISNCSRYYREVENALLANETNKYQLHEQFFPSSRLSPIYGYVSYNITADWYVRGLYVWSNSILFAYIPPNVISSMMLELLIAVLSVTKFPIPKTDSVNNYIIPSYQDSDVGLQLQLSLNLTTEIDNGALLNAVLNDLTSWLKVYASTQGNQGNWKQQDYQYKGYSSFIFESYNVIIYLIYLMLIQFLVLVFATTFLIRFTPTLYQKAAESRSEWVSFYWASSLVTGLCNIAIIVCELTISIMYFIWSFDVLRITKMCCLVTYLFVDFLLALCINKSSTLHPPRIIRCVFCICCPFCCCSENCHLGLIQTMAIWNILAFVHFTTWTIVPITLYTFVFPLQTLSVLALFATTIFCVITLISLLIKKSSMRWSRSSCKANCQIILPVIQILTFLALVILTTALYLKFFTKGLQVNSIGGFVVSFFPSAILTIIGWFVTKGKFFKWLPTHTPTHGREPDMAEEGVRSSNTDSQNYETLVQTASETTSLLN